MNNIPCDKQVDISTAENPDWYRYVQMVNIKCEITKCAIF
jgi:hypothetical protein